ncbi:MAG: peptide chain release factor N(5)-glutamine methyltransferase [Deltaproteobacteria bacterium]|nr:peptide chain release factor N(5)-glutamine methyltransferase [Deltaproteobacteria bacterium]
MNLKNSYNFDIGIDKDLSVYKLIKWGELCLKGKNISNPFNESAVIMGYVLKKPLDGVITSYNIKPAKNHINLFKRLIIKRSLGEPYAYIVKKKEFYSTPFFVNKSVLIPRPDTECLVEETLKEIERLQKGLKRKISIIDLGTGSGSIAISIAKNSSNVIIYAADNSFKSLEVAKKNIIFNGVEDKVVSAYFDMLKPDICWIDEPQAGAAAGPLEPAPKAKLFDNALYDFDIIVSNPPYIKTGELKTLDDGIKLYEPLKALNGGKDGLRFYRKIFELAALAENPLSSASKKRKSLILEIDYREKSAIEHLYNEKFKDIIFKQITFINDLNKKERAVKIIYGQNDN